MGFRFFLAYFFMTIACLLAFAYGNAHLHSVAQTQNVPIVAEQASSLLLYSVGH